MRFSLANIAIVIGFLLYTQRTADVSYLSWFIADMALLIGFMLVRWGGQHLFKMPHTTLRDSTVLITSALLMLLVPPQITYAIFTVLIMNAVSVYIFALITKDNYLAFRKGLSAPYAALVSIPVSLVAILFIVRSIALILYPEKIELLAAADSLHRPEIMWAYIILLLLVNIILFGNAITRLVYKIKGLANKDQLTGLWNRHALMNKLTEVDNLWLRDKRQYSILILDLDFFKAINDNYGHLVGDKALIHTAKILKNTLRNVDFICRYGGEEFLVILPSTNERQSMIVAEKLQVAINKLPLKYKQSNIEVTASIGCASSQIGLSVEQLLKLADDAMYQAKEQGRNTICFTHLSNSGKN
ncbi:diguanylate cyclase [Shewanella maritima]|uniref:GGDEF domain-containing protein n=1 Tax=Shewanella maritima TaxID=2520507 RepID=UPI003735FA18